MSRKNAQFDEKLYRKKHQTTEITIGLIFTYQISGDDARERNHRIMNFRECEFHTKNPNLFAPFPGSCDIQQLKFFFQQDLRKFLQHKFCNCIQIRLQSLTRPVS